MTPNDIVLPHLFDRLHLLLQCSHGSVQTLNEHLPQLEGEIDGETIAYETDEFRAIMVSSNVGSYTGATKSISILMQPNAQTMHRKFYCFNLTNADQAVNAWSMITHRSPSLFKKGTIHRPKDFTKSMGLLNTMAD